jgi:hypothetical protein
MVKTKFGQMLTSRTFWTVIVMLVFNLLPQLPLDQAVKDLVNTILTVLVVYFKLNPTQINAPSGSTITQTTPTTVTVTTPPVVQ